MSLSLQETRTLLLARCILSNWGLTRYLPDDITPWRSPVISSYSPSMQGWAGCVLECPQRNGSCAERTRIVRS